MKTNNLEGDKIYTLFEHIPLKSGLSLLPVSLSLSDRLVKVRRPCSKDMSSMASGLEGEVAVETKYE